MGNSDRRNRFAKMVADCGGGGVPYALAWFSHFFVEHNRPATFGHPLWSWAADQKMVAMALAGKMGKEAERCAAEQAKTARS